MYVMNASTDFDLSAGLLLYFRRSVGKLLDSNPSSNLCTLVGYEKKHLLLEKNPTIGISLHGHQHSIAKDWPKYPLLVDTQQRAETDAAKRNAKQLHVELFGVVSLKRDSWITGRTQLDNEPC